MLRNTILAIVVASSLLPTLVTARAAEVGASSDSRLVVVNGNSGRVIFDDGRDDVICVYRRNTIGYDDYGRAVRRGRMHCR